MYKYHKPADVLSPKDCISNVRTIYDGGANPGEFSVAIVEWNEEPCIGVRWNITEREIDDEDKISGKKICVGEPNSRGYPTWFILPNDLLIDLTNGSKISREISKYLETLKGK
jgi:hypothetical protein